MLDSRSFMTNRKYSRDNIENNDKVGETKEEKFLCR